MILPLFTSSSTGLYESGPRSISAVKVLRISLTDRCNFRCLYCMPAEGVQWLPKDNLMTLEEIVDVVRSAVEVHGIRRFKLTGGEPTLRRGLTDLVRMLRGINGVEDLSLTTNGFSLHDQALPLKEAGLNRITISIDSLHPEKFNRITRTGDLKTVLRGLERAEEVGFDGLKVNCVTMRGTNDDEVVDFARLTVDRKLTVRFIEYMPLGDSQISSFANPLSAKLVDHSELGPAGGCGAQDRGKDGFFSEIETRMRIESELGELIPVDRDREPGVGPANVYQLAGENIKGRVGFISAMSAPFCSTCNRLRLTADGVLRSCLFEGGEIPIRELMRSIENKFDRQYTVAKAMSDCVQLKPFVHSGHGNEQMSRIGG